jgi:hypothetical protein
MQSRYAAMAIIASLLAVALIVVFSKEKIGFGKKLMVVALMFLLSLPSMLYVLFQITCLVTGTSKGAWWCGIYAWLLSGLIILYSILIILMSVLSLSANAEAQKIEQFYAEQDESNDEAKKLMEDEVPSRPVMDQSEPAVPDSNNMVEQPIPTPEEAPEEAPVVNATVEEFSSCGAPWGNNY